MDVYTRFYQIVRSFRPHHLLKLRYERELERNQWLDREEIQQVAWQKLKKLLEYAYEKVPFYHQRFQETGLTPQDIQTPEDYCRLPILTKDDIRKNEDKFIAEGFSKDAMLRVVTSGSTGMPFVVYHDHFFEAMNFAAFARSRRWYGWESGDKVAWIWGRQEDIRHSFKQRLVYYLKRERWLEGLRLTSERMRLMAEMLARWKPDLIAGYTNVIYLFAQYLESQGITGIRPKVMETAAMPLWPGERELIERVFQCPVSDRYGTHESGSVVASECPQGSRHVFIDCCYLEILNNGRPAPPGTEGEVVATPLHAVGMPLLRFRLGDVAVWDDRPCPCGRGLPLLRDIVGRITGIITLPSGRLLYGAAICHLVQKDALAIRRFRVHQYSPEKIEITLERGPNFDSSVVDAIRARCLEFLGNEPVDLTISVTDEIPSTAAGKLLVVTSDVPPRLV